MIVFVCAWLKMYKFIFFLIKLQYSHKKNVIETLGMILKKKKNPQNSLGTCKAYASLLPFSEYFGWTRSSHKNCEKDYKFIWW